VTGVVPFEFASVRLCRAAIALLRNFMRSGSLKHDSITFDSDDLIESWKRTAWIERCSCGKGAAQNDSLLLNNVLSSVKERFLRLYE
jgi:hypothetical protein